MAEYCFHLKNRMSTAYCTALQPCRLASVLDIVDIYLAASRLSKYSPLLYDIAFYYYTAQTSGAHTIISGADPGIFDRGGPRVFPKMWSKFKGNFWRGGGVWGPPREKKIEISGSEKCILVDPGDGFAMDNRERKKPSGLIGGSGSPLPSPWIRHWILSPRNGKRTPLKDFTHNFINTTSA